MRKYGFLFHPSTLYLTRLVCDEPPSPIGEGCQALLDRVRYTCIIYLLHNLQLRKLQHDFFIADGFKVDGGNTVFAAAFHADDFSLIESLVYYMHASL